MAAIIETSIHRGSKVDMGGGVYFCSEAGRAASPTPLSSGAVVLVLCMEQTGQEAQVRIVRVN